MPKRVTSCGACLSVSTLRQGNTASIEELSQWWRAVGNTTVFELTGPRFETQISLSRNDRVTARSTVRKMIFSVS